VTTKCWLSCERAEALRNAHIDAISRALKAGCRAPFIVLVTESITPRPQQEPQIRFQPSMLSVPSSAATVPPERKTALGVAKPTAGARRKLWFFTALAAFAGVVGADALGADVLGAFQHTSPEVRSGSPGIRTGKSGKPLHWHSKALTVYLDDSLTRLGPQANEAVMQAFGRWVEGDARLPDLSFDSGKTSAIPQHDGKSTISYGRITAAGHERDLAITVTYADDKTGEIVEADIVLNSMYPMGVLTAKASTAAPDKHEGKGDDNHNGKGDDNHNGKGDDNHSGSKSMSDETMDCQNRYDIQNVTTHEVGHFFGLGEDTSERSAAMFQTIDQCETHKRTLASTDLTAMSALYADTEDPEEAAAGPRACSVGGAHQPYNGSWAWISAAFVGLALVRRRR
jgi:hypothetical protein